MGGKPMNLHEGSQRWRLEDSTRTTLDLLRLQTDGPETGQSPRDLVKAPRQWTRRSLLFGSTIYCDKGESFILLCRKAPQD